MSENFNWYQYCGASTAETSLGTGGNLCNFKAIDTPGTLAYDTNPIVAGQNSMLIYLKGAWGGTFNMVNDIRFWMDTDFSPNTGLSVYWKTDGTNTYATPSTATTVAANTIPTTNPGAENVYIGGTAGGSLTAAGKSDYIPLQLRTTTAAAAGDTSLAEFTLTYDVS